MSYESGVFIPITNVWLEQRIGYRKFSTTNIVQVDAHVCHNLEINLQLSNYKSHRRKYSPS